MSIIKDALNRSIQISDKEIEPTPHMGDLWELSWDGIAPTLVLVIGLRETFIKAWPITVAAGYETFPCFPIDSFESSGNRLVGWPDAEFCFNRALLRRCLRSKALSPLEVRRIVYALDEQKEFPREFCNAQDSEDARDALTKVCMQAWNLADIEWPSASASGIILPQTWDEGGLSAREIGEILDIAPGHAADMYMGILPPAEDELKALQAKARATLARQSPTGCEVIALMNPKLKQRIQRVATLRSMSEAAIRDEILPMARAAARQDMRVDPMEAALRRVESVLEMLIK